MDYPFGSPDKMRSGAAVAGTKGAARGLAARCAEELNLRSEIVPVHHRLEYEFLAKGVQTRAAAPRHPGANWR
jgi:hypothetical protein